MEGLKGDILVSQEDAHPCISWDESYIIFDSSERAGVRDNDLFVSFQSEDGTWSEAFNLGQFLGLDNSGLARISADGESIYFHSDGDIYRMDTEVIEAIKTNEHPPGAENRA